jgi:hypothetical protein
MNDQIHRINDIIKQVPDLRYDSSAGVFETDRRALYDFAELIVAECVAAIMTKDRYRREYFARVVQRRFGMLDDGDDDE